MRGKRKRPVGCKCSRCKHPLSDAVSVAAGMGKVCRLKIKQIEMADKNGNLFNAEYNWGTKDNILYIEDLNAPRSVTHDIQNVLADIAMRLPDEKLSELKIMYKDSFGVWDGVSASITKDNSSGKAKIAITGLNFFSINENDFNKAIEKLKRK